LRGIGEVIAVLRPEFPDITISKVRFLEDEGLVRPFRTPAGYRKYAQADVARLRFVLATQRDTYAPLKEIREYLTVLDAGGDPPPMRRGLRPPRTLVVADALEMAAPLPPQRYTLEQIASAAKLEARAAAELVEYQLVAPGPDGLFDHAAMQVAGLVGELADHGIEVRHLRGAVRSARAQAALISQAMASRSNPRSESDAGRAEDRSNDLFRLMVLLHGGLLGAEVRGFTGG
jgi:DNA-binding transcriptional MerR regulator